MTSPFQNISVPANKSICVLFLINPNAEKMILIIFGFLGLRYPSPFNFPHHYYSFSASVYSFKILLFCTLFLDISKCFFEIPHLCFPTLSQFFQISVSFFKFLFLCCSFSDIRVLFEIPLGRNSIEELCQ